MGRSQPETVCAIQPAAFWRVPVPSSALLARLAPLTPVPGRPDLVAHHAPDVFALWQAWEEECGAPQAVPFWATVWPAGQLLTRVVQDEPAWVRGQTVLEVGCGIGTDLVRFAKGGARVTGVDLSATAIDLARENFALHGLTAVELQVANAEALPYPDASFDHVYGHGVIQYTADPAQLIRECHRVVKPGGTGIFTVYNRVSWLNVLSRVMKVPLEHEDAPVLRRYSIEELEQLMTPFKAVTIIPERFPVKSRLHKGWKGLAFNAGFVGVFNALPRSWVRRYGWHLLADARK